MERTASLLCSWRIVTLFNKLDYKIEIVILVPHDVESDGGHGQGVWGGRHLQQEPHHKHQGSLIYTVNLITKLPRNGAKAHQK
jgi:hypothetical protein